MRLSVFHSLSDWNEALENDIGRVVCQLKRRLGSGVTAVFSSAGCVEFLFRLHALMDCDLGLLGLDRRYPRLPQYLLTLAHTPSSPVLCVMVTAWEYLLSQGLRGFRAMDTHQWHAVYRKIYAALIDQGHWTPPV
ncbi:hypothetical protein KIPB_013756, partial [Kipferlia bialata]|eukprot:g13756.t1